MYSILLFIVTRCQIKQRSCAQLYDMIYVIIKPDSYYSKSDSEGGSASSSLHLCIWAGLCPAQCTIKGPLGSRFFTLTHLGRSFA